MKNFILLSVVFCTSSAFRFIVNPLYAKSWDAMLDVHREECILESGVNRIEATTSVLTMNLPEDPQFKCFAKCVFQKWGFYDPITNSIDVDKITNSVMGVQKSVVEECFQQYINEVNQCEKVFSVVTCAISKLQSSLI
ncbi:general odorant-binding protein 99a-like [Photinus pyralis]|uniref:general odorant-binding protein 99a-like n=1 Tax=Photinus pyralis TaxID=7054 RepID=UPI0012674D23|nr:general odorant-binding protein 99a-like [Photinus pyralis]